MVINKQQITTLLNTIVGKPQRTVAPPPTAQNNSIQSTATTNTSKPKSPLKQEYDGFTNAEKNKLQLRYSNQPSTNAVSRIGYLNSLIDIEGQWSQKMSEIVANQNTIQKTMTTFTAALPDNIRNAVKGRDPFQLYNDPQFAQYKNQLGAIIKQFQKMGINNSQEYKTINDINVAEVSVLMSKSAEKVALYNSQLETNTKLQELTLRGFSDSNSLASSSNG